MPHTTILTESRQYERLYFSCMVAPFFWKNKIFRTLVGNFFVECSFFSGICEDSGFLFHAYKDKIIAIYYDILSRVNRPATKEFKKKTMKVTVAFIFFYLQFSCRIWCNK